MRLIDLSTSTRLSKLMETVDSLSRLYDPKDLLETLISGMRHADYPSQLFILVSTRRLGAGKYRISRIVTASDQELTEAHLPWDNATLPIQSGGLIGQMVLSPNPKLALDLDLPSDPILSNILQNSRAMIAAPIFNDGAPADWVFFFNPRPDGFTIIDLEEMILRANLVGAATSNLRLAREIFSANQRIQQEVEQIAAIQRAILPQSPPNIPGLSIAASYETFDLAGGDIYDFVELRSPTPPAPAHRPNRRSTDIEPVTRWAIMIGDVAGHGPAAAVVMAMVHSILHTYPGKPHGPATLLSHVNQHLCAKPIGYSFVTAFLGIYDPQHKTLAYARAGHHPPLLLDPNHGAQTLNAVGDIPLGILPDLNYHESTLQLSPGQALILYTDGVSESPNLQNQWFGLDGIANAITPLPPTPAQIIQKITTSLRQHQDHLRPRDDQTIVAISIT